MLFVTFKWKQYDSANFNRKIDIFAPLVNMFKCLRLHQTKSTNVFPSIRFRAFSNCTSRHHLFTHFTRNAQNFKVNSSFIASDKNIHTAAAVPVQQSAVAQENIKYESNTLPKNARVVICGGGVMGGKFTSNYKKKHLLSQFFAFHLYLAFFHGSYSCCRVSYRLTRSCK